MAKGATFANDLLKLIFNATAIANLADNTVTNPFGFLFWALHTADPTAAGTQNSSEANYTGYTRLGVARTTGGMTASSAGSTSPVANLDFPAATGGTNTITNFSIGAAAVNPVTVTSAAPGVVSLTAHGLLANQPVVFGGTAVPTGLTAGTIYYVTAANLLANSFTVSAAPGGAAITTTSTGTAVQLFAGSGATKILYSGTVTPNISVTNGVTPRLTTASTITEV